MYLFFFSLLVWQGVSTSRKNAEEPRIATCVCQVTAGYAVFFIRFHLLIADTEAAEIYAHKTALMKTLWVTACTVFTVRVCQVSNASRKQLLNSALDTESFCVVYHNNFVGTFGLLL